MRSVSLARACRAWLVRASGFFRGRQLERDFAAEIDSHLQLHIDDNLRAGLTPHEARRVALARLGGLTQVTQRHRERRGIPAIEHVARDVRMGARSLRRTPGLTSVAILTLGIGIGATTGVFGFVNAVLLRPLPIASPDEVVFLNREGPFPSLSFPDYVDLRDRNNVFADLAAYRFSPVNFGDGGMPIRIWGYLATGNYFEMLGVSASIGRVFTRADDVAPGAHPVVVLSHPFWERQFASDPAVIGREVTLNGRRYTVIGVAVQGFTGTERYFAPDVWVPMMMQAQIEPANPWLDRRNTRNAFVIGRRRPGVTNAQAHAALQALARELAREHPQINEGMRFSLSEPGLAGHMLRAPVVAFSGALAGVAGIVLLLTCTNLTGLLLARAVDRQRYTAICLAIGASRGTLIRQLLIEAGLLCTTAAALAIGFTYALGRMLGAWRLPVDFPLVVGFAADQNLFWFAAGVALLTTVLVGIAPALHDSRADLINVLKDDVRTRARWPLRDVVVALQIALSVVLLVGSVLVIRSLREAGRLDVGFNAESVVTARMDLDLQGYDENRGRQLQRQLIERLSTHAAIHAVSIGSAIPLSLDQSTNGIYIEGRPAPRASEVPIARYYQVWPNFFGTLQTPLVSGRDFDLRDGRQRVAIINEAFAEQIVGSGDPIGTRFRNGPTGDWWTIIGVVRTGKYFSLSENPLPVVFYWGSLSYSPSTVIFARGYAPEAETTRIVREAVADLAPGVSLYNVQPLTRTLEVQLFPARVAAFALSAFGSLTLLLVALGVYALVSYSIARRTREICIRLAIGASARQVVKLVLGRALVIWAVGAALGVSLAFIGGPMLSPLLLGGVTPRAPSAFVASALLLAGVAALACWAPTRRAFHNDPAGLLRRE